MEKQNSHIYVINGFGNNQVVAEQLGLQRYDHTFLAWFDAYDSESIKMYVKRFKWQIKEPRPILIGISFGGIIAIEIAKIMDITQVIVISSATCRRDLPFFAKLLGATKIFKLLPINALFTNIFMDRAIQYFHPEIKDMMRGTISDVYDNIFIRWAIERLLTWPGRNIPPNTVQIHGTDDEFLPVRCMTDPIMIQGGRHLMVFSHSAIIAAQLKALLLTGPAEQ